MKLSLNGVLPRNDERLGVLEAKLIQVLADGNVIELSEEPQSTDYTNNQYWLCKLQANGVYNETRITSDSSLQHALNQMNRMSIFS